MIKIYPVSIEAVDEYDVAVFKLQAFDNQSATLEVNGIITNSNVNEFCSALNRAIAMLDLDREDKECP